MLHSFMTCLHDIVRGLPQVVELLSTVIEHLVKGEIMQMIPNSSREHLPEAGVSAHLGSLDRYLRKNFFKTASLMGNSCLAASVLGERYPTPPLDLEAHHLHSSLLACLMTYLCRREQCRVRPSSLPLRSARRTSLPTDRRCAGL